jgi:hypothetical protein
MKQELNKEMDLLLRRLGRDSTSVPNVSDKHMDADELNAYAEHSLPAAARARYTDHLADCAKCREIVTGLSASFGLPVSAKVEAPAEKASFKSFLMGLLSPQFARYAIPTLALVGIVAIGLVVFRQQSARNRGPVQLDSVAQTQNTESRATPAKPESSSSELKSASPLATPAPEANEAKNQRKQDDAKQEEAPAPAAIKAPAEAPGATPVAAPKVAKTEDADSVTRAEPEVARKRADPVERQKQAGDDRERDEQQRREAKPYDQGMTGQSGPSKGESKNTEVRKKEVAQNAAPPAPAPATTTASAGGGSRGNADKAKDAEEVRSVAGRRFYREGKTWIDTSYESGGATTNVTRGSDHYRSLIADEPEIRTIADSLSGEVIVVWKGRAYKIK